MSLICHLSVTLLKILRVFLAEKTVLFSAWLALFSCTLVGPFIPSLVKDINF